MFFQVRSIKADVFVWLEQVQESLERGQQVPESTTGTEENEASDDENEDFGFFEQKGVPYRVTIQKMKDLIFKRFADFVAMDPAQSVKLVDAWFDGDYNEVAGELKEQKDLSFNFLNTVL